MEPACVSNCQQVCRAAPVTTARPPGAPSTPTTVAMSAAKRGITPTTVTVTVAAGGAGNEQPEQPPPIKHLHTLMNVHAYSVSHVQRA